MKRCPECRKDYLDDSLLYCLDDGSALLQGTVGDEPVTAILSGDRGSDEDLTAVLKASERTNSVTLRMPAFLSWQRLPWILAVMLLIVSVLLGVIYIGRPVPDERPVSFVISRPESATDIGTPNISPDGRTIAFVMTVEGKPHIYLRELGSLTERRLDGTEDAATPFWSPDSRTVAFFSSDKLKKVDIASGPVQVLCNAPRGYSGAWSRDGVIVFGGWDKGIRRVPASGGEVTELLPLDESRKESLQIFPRFLPSGRHFFYKSHNSGQTDLPEIFIASIDGKESRPLFKNFSDVFYIEPGYLLFARDTTVMAQPFDASSLQFTGDPIPVVENVAINRSNGRSHFSVSENGTLVYKNREGVQRQLTWFDRQGKQISIVGPPGEYVQVVLSSDGKSVAASLRANGNLDIWLIALESGLPTRFTFNAASENDPAWSPDGSYILFSSDRDGDTRKLYRKLANRAGSDELISDDAGLVANGGGASWSPDGKNALYSNRDDKTGMDIWVLAMTGDAKPYPMLQSEFNERMAHFSPDGRFFAYVSNESGEQEVYVQSFPPAGGKWQISTGGGAQPQWRSDGKELYYIAPAKNLMAVAVKSGETFETGAAIPLFQTEVELFILAHRYAVAPDGQRFLINTPVESTKEAPFNVILNWTATLKK